MLVSCVLYNITFIIFVIGSFLLIKMKKRQFKNWQSRRNEKSIRSKVVHNCQRLSDMELSWHGDMKIRFIACGIEPRHRNHVAKAVNKTHADRRTKNKIVICYFCIFCLFVRICSDLQIICHVLFVYFFFLSHGTTTDLMLRQLLALTGTQCLCVLLSK